MYIKSCPSCGRMPKIHEGRRRQNGKHFYGIGCPNYCWVLKSQENRDYFPYATTLYFEGDYDYNYLYKQWNENLIEKGN